MSQIARVKSTGSTLVAGVGAVGFVAVVVGLIAWVFMPSGKGAASGRIRARGIAS